MKRNIKLVLIAFLLFCLVCDVSASTTTYSRSENDYRVPKNIIVNDSNKNNILATPSVNTEEKIYDFADLYTDKEEKVIYDKIQKFIKNKKLDLAIVTISNNNKASVQNYAYDFYDYNGFGLTDSFDGLLLLIDMQNSAVFISTTGKAIVDYDDELVNKILRPVYDEMANGNYETAINKFFENLYVSDLNEDSNSSNWYFIVIAAFLATVITIIVLIISMKKEPVKTIHNKYLLDEKTKIVLVEEKELNKENTIINDSNNK